MESVTNFFQSLGIDLQSHLLGGAVIIFGLLLISLLSRFIFGKKSNLNFAVSSAIGIVLMCALMVGISYIAPALYNLLPAMPFVQFQGKTLYLFSFSGSDYTQICSQLLSMVTLSFVFNTLDRWMPKPKNIFGWLFFRVLTLVLALALHLFVSMLIHMYLPTGLIIYAPVVLLAILVLMLLTGALKLPVGVLLSTVNPVIGGLYTFFFATILGKMITRAVFTTAILSLLVTALKYIGITAISIAASVLIAYIPLLIILLVLWYLINRLL